MAAERGPFRRAGRRTNVALLCLLLGAFLTGWLAFAAGTPVPAFAATLAHGLLGLGVVVLVPWKTVVVRRAPALRVASLTLLAVVAICLVSGFVEVFGGYGTLLRLSPIQVHVGAALVAVPLVTWHLLAHRRQRLRRVDLSRRNLLRTAGFAVGTGAAYAALECVGTAAGSRSADRLATGSHALAPAEVPATIWLLDRVPTLPVTGFAISVAGRSVDADDLDRRGQAVRARLDCTSGWYVEATWSGVALADLLDPVRLAAARSVVVTSVTGYRRTFPAVEADRLWLATRYEGRRLGAGIGAPVRLVAPHRRGFWWVKWVARVELSDRPAYVQSPFPLQ